jgi:hypothetical protein
MALPSLVARYGPIPESGSHLPGHFRSQEVLNASPLGGEEGDEHRLDDEESLDPEGLLNEIQETLRAEQNLIGGFGAGLFAAIVGAGLWAAVAAATGYLHGWIAAGVGYLVGVAVHRVGKGVDSSFGVVGAGLSLFGCVLGNFFTIVYFASQSVNMGIVEVLPHIDFAAIPGVMMGAFEPVDIFFYVLAIYTGYRYSFQPVTIVELDETEKDGTDATPKEKGDHELNWGHLEGGVC